MSSPRSSTSVDGETADRANGGALVQVLDVAFGFFVWAVHFLTVYIATAVACTLRLGDASAGTRTTFLAALALVTVVAAAVVAWHALRRYRRWRNVSEELTRMALTMGCDAIAAIAIAWQVFPILLVPPCV